MKRADDSQTSSAVKSVDRALDLFELLARWDRELSHTEIADALDIPKSSLTLLLRNLVMRGYLEFSAASRTYRLGKAFSALARQSGREFDLVACAEPVLQGLTNTLGESSALNRMKGQATEIIATVVSPQRLVTHMHVGDTAPLYATSAGKVILAHLSTEQQKEYLRTVRFEHITASTVNSVAGLKKQIDAARRTGLAYSKEEFTPGIVGVAAVIPGTPGTPLGAIHIAMPAVRSSRKVLEHASKVLLQAVQEILKQVARSQQLRPARSKRA